jgi:hypothetical protein
MLLADALGLGLRYEAFGLIQVVTDGWPAIRKFAGRNGFVFQP